jgi:hypothetical protein
MVSKVDRLQNLGSNNKEDEMIREGVRRNDMDLIKQVHEDLAREEKELKEFFGELKEPTKEDPTMTSNNSMYLNPTRKETL